MSFDWLQHAFLIVTVVVILTLIIDVYVSKLNSFKKHLSDYTEDVRSYVVHSVDVTTKKI